MLMSMLLAPPAPTCAASVTADALVRCFLSMPTLSFRRKPRYSGDACHEPNLAKKIWPQKGTKFSKIDIREFL
jgi:hypothetical protein